MKLSPAQSRQQEIERLSVLLQRMVSAWKDGIETEESKRLIDECDAVLALVAHDEPSKKLEKRHAELMEALIEWGNDAPWTGPNLNVALAYEAYYRARAMTVLFPIEHQYGV